MPLLNPPTPLQLRTFYDRLHNLAALDECLPASAAVDMAKYRIDATLSKRLPNDDSLIEKVNRRRNNGSLHHLNKAFSECELPLSFQQTIDGEPFLLLDYQGGVSGSLAPLSFAFNPVVLQATPGSSFSPHRQDSRCWPSRTSGASTVPSASRTT